LVSCYPAFAAFVPHGLPITGVVLLPVEEVEAFLLSYF
jgi:predicted DNA-binding protein (UPF0251 family)